MPPTIPPAKQNRASALRPYQQECLASILSAYKQGRRRLLISLPTGTGKTVVFVNFVRGFQMKKKLLVLAHRDELLEQARDKLALYAPEASVSIEQGSRHADPDSKVVIASVATLGRANSKRLSALSPDAFSIVVVDEAHHAVAATYQRILEHFGPFDAANHRLLVGFTATPRRGDGQALGRVFEEITFSRGIEEMIREGWLCDVSGLRVRTDVNLDTVQVRHGDFVESQLAKAVNVKTRNDTVVEAYCRYASDRRAIVFCVDVAHTRAMAETFQRAGLKSQAVWGEMTREDRRAALESFRRGTTTVLTNCNVLTEGFDEPRVSCVIMARPTKSRLLYAQMIGRGTRLHEDKPNLLVMDLADNSREHSLAGIHHVFDVPDNLDLEGSDALVIADSLRALVNDWPWINVERIENASDLRLLQDARDGVVSARHAVAERFWLFSFDPPDALRDLTAFSWHSAPGGDFALDVGSERLLVSRTLLDEWKLLRLGSGVREELQTGRNLEQIITFADRWVETERPDKLTLVLEYAGWRGLDPTERQLDFLRRMGVPIPESLTRGQASLMISHLTGRHSRARNAI
jgi:superfamily II DNA or RNA helicase